MHINLRNMVDEITARYNENAIAKESGYITNDTIFMSMSTIFTELIKEAAKNKQFSSDLLIEVCPLYEALKYCTDVSKFIGLCNSDHNDWLHQRDNQISDEVHIFVKYLGFRNSGVDHRDFIKHSLIHANTEYRRILKISVVIHNNEIVAFLNECDFKTLVDLNAVGNF